MSLKEYRAKRSFNKTPEPKGQSKGSAEPIFVIQKHQASHLHFDFRLEIDGVLKSWAVPKGPPEQLGEKRLAVETEDHPIEYAEFEGSIPKGEYGAGLVEIWDKGLWHTDGSPKAQLKKGHLEFSLSGERLKGTWLLVRTKSKNPKKPHWFLIKRTHAAPSAEPQLDVSFEKLPARSSLPMKLEPQLCQTSVKAPTGPGWIHEVKFDGYRTLCRIQNAKPTLFTRSGLDWTAKYEAIARDLKTLKAKTAWLDGEVCAVDSEGRTSFSNLQEALEQGDSKSLIYFVFDLLYLDGRDLRNLPLLQRKSILKDLIQDSDLKQVIYSEHHTQEGRLVLASAKRQRLEGIISKNAHGTYEHGRSSQWLKVKTKNTEELIIAGYTLQDSGQLAALVMATHESDKTLRYLGRVGTGFNQKNSAELIKKLKTLQVLESPFAERVPLEGKITWVKPTLVAQIDFAAWTGHGHLRHGVFQGLRNDKKAKDVIATDSSKLALTSGERIVFSELGLTKSDLGRYYQKAAPQILAHISQRPVTVFRCPEGIAGTCFFQKHLEKKTAAIRVQTSEDLLKLVQLNALEFHMSHLNIKARGPDLIVFDLDPDPKVSWARVKAAALELKDILDRLKLVSYLKTSGNKGLHIHVPVRTGYTWAQIEMFAKSVCHQLVLQNPDEYTLNILKKNRKNKIFLDYLRNKKDSTSVAPYSVRAKPHAAVALPLRWQDLKKLKSSDQFSLVMALDLLDQNPDPWTGYFSQHQKIAALDQMKKKPAKKRS